MTAVLLTAGVASAQVDCATQPNNQVPNCGFPVNTANWSLVIGDSLTHSATEGDGALGAAVIDAADQGGSFATRLYSACIGIGAGEKNIGGSFKLAGGGSGSVQCIVRAVIFGGGDPCTTLQQVLEPLSGPVTPTTGGWVRQFYSATALGSEFALQIDCTDSVDFAVLLDDGLFGQNLIPVELTHFAVE